jgi:hypothetical protein
MKLIAADLLTKDAWGWGECGNHGMILTSNVSFFFSVQSHDIVQSNYKYRPLESRKTVFTFWHYDSRFIVRTNMHKGTLIQSEEGRG